MQVKVLGRVNLKLSTAAACVHWGSFLLNGAVRRNEHFIFERLFDVTVNHLEVVVFYMNFTLEIKFLFFFAPLFYMCSLWSTDKCSNVWKGELARKKYEALSCNLYIFRLFL